MQEVKHFRRAWANFPKNRDLGNNNEEFVTILRLRKSGQLMPNRQVTH
jgi:hypothetical protein